MVEPSRYNVGGDDIVLKNKLNITDQKLIEDVISFG